MSDTYRERPPPPSLRSCVRCLWSYESESSDRPPERIAPDGCAELVLHLRQPYEEYRDGAFEPQPAMLFAGQSTRPLILRAPGPSSCVGVRFHPHTPRRWTRQPMSRFTDRRVDARELQPELQEIVACRSALSTAEALQRLAACLEPRLESSDALPDERVAAEVEALESGATPVPEAGEDARQLQRLFLRDVGISRRTLRSVLRFRRVFDRARAEDGYRWLIGGLDAGYFDQPQLAREFRRFLGCTATEWAADQLGLARAIASQTYKTGAAAGLD
jgi:AraC-like DNA-binding protein